jgi:diamine N-acetyltransferase
VIEMPAVSLQQITFETVRAIIALDVSSNQRPYVASNAVSIAEAHFNPGAWLRAIYSDNTAVGFVMLLDPSIPGALSRSPIASDELVLWRLMIDSHYQRLRYGQKALDLVCHHARSFNNVKWVLSSYVEGPYGPERFYLNYGFAKTGRSRNNGSEVEIALPLSDRK